MAKEKDSIKLFIETASERAAGICSTTAVVELPFYPDDLEDDDRIFLKNRFAEFFREILAMPIRTVYFEDEEY